MISFAYPPGLLLLLIIPLLLFFIRKRSIPRRELLTAFFLLKELKKGGPPKTLKIFRLSRKYRRILMAFILTCLSLAISGTTLRYEGFVPENWLVVFDNTPLGSKDFGEGSIHEATAAFLAERVKDLDGRDLVTVVTTSPSPSVHTFSPGGPLEEHFRSIPLASRSSSFDEAAGTVRDLAGFASRTIVLSPRSGRWREGFSEEAAEKGIIIPEDRHTARGNTGIVSARLRPGSGPEGEYDLFLLMESSDDTLREVSVEGRTREGEVLPFGPVPMRGGRARLFRQGLRVPYGEILLTLQMQDAFAGDDSTSLFIEKPRPLSLSLRGEGRPVFEAALSSSDLFTVKEDGESDVDIYLGDSPEEVTKPSLVIYPPEDRIGLTFQKLADTRGEIIWHPDHPLTAGLSRGGFRPRRVALYHFGREMETVATVDGHPALIAGRREGYPLAVWAFNPLVGELFLKPEFVILLHESVAWLASEGQRNIGRLPDRELTAAAREVSQPALLPELFKRTRREERTLDLTPFFAAAVLLAGIYLALADTAGAEEKP